MMAFTVTDFEDLLRILEEKPEWRQRMREAILGRQWMDCLRSSSSWWRWYNRSRKRSDVRKASSGRWTVNRLSGVP